METLGKLEYEAHVGGLGKLKLAGFPNNDGSPGLPGTFLVLKKSRCELSNKS